MSAIIKKPAKKEAAKTEAKVEKRPVKTSTGKLMTLVPRMSEKAYTVSETLNTYVFVVPKSASKQSVAQAVSVQFNVAVIGVNTANYKGKEIRTYRKRSRAVSGRQNDYKKAFVTLKKGDSLPLFAAVEEAEAKTEKLQEAAEKRAKKEKK